MSDAAPGRLVRLWGYFVLLVMVGFTIASPAVIAARQLRTAPAGAADGGGGTAGAATVTMAGLTFRPATVTVAKGATVTFVNDDTAPHTVTADDGPVDSGVLDPGGRFSLTADTGFAYHCAIHPSMTARVAVAT